MNERFFRQAWETFIKNIDNIKHGDTLNAFNFSINRGRYCPTLTTRPEEFKTAIIVIVEEN